jgi:predicted negative regulator of RcsB-dependent stress response
MFRDIVQKYPQSWNAQDSLGEALALKGDKAGAIAAYEKALAMVIDPDQKKRIAQTLAKLKK